MADVRFGSKADIVPRPRHVRFTPESGHSLRAAHSSVTGSISSGILLAHQSKLLSSKSKTAGVWRWYLLSRPGSLGDQQKTMEWGSAMDDTNGAVPTSSMFSLATAMDNKRENPASICPHCGEPMRVTATIEGDGEIIFEHSCKLGCEGIVSKRVGSLYRSGRSPRWVKVKNPKAPAVECEAEEDWGR
jgi:hypothetical protein